MNKQQWLGRSKQDLGGRTHGRRWSWWHDSGLPELYWIQLPPKLEPQDRTTPHRTAVLRTNWKKGKQQINAWVGISFGANMGARAREMSWWATSVVWEKDIFGASVRSFQTLLMNGFMWLNTQTLNRFNLINQLIREYLWVKSMQVDGLCLSVNKSQVFFSPHPTQFFISIFCTIIAFDLLYFVGAHFSNTWYSSNGIFKHVSLVKEKYQSPPLFFWAHAQLWNAWRNRFTRRMRTRSKNKGFGALHVQLF